MKQPVTPIFSEIMEDIRSIPVIDLHSHIDAKHPDANDVKDIVFYEYILNELRSAGMRIDFSVDIAPAEELMKRALPFFKLIRNTSTYWCLTAMLKELYGFDEDINGENWKNLFEKIRSRFDRDNWYEEVLSEKARIEKTFLTFRCNEPIPTYDSRFFIGALRIDSLTDITREDVKNLEENVSVPIASLDGLENGIEMLFEKSKGHCAATTAYFPPSVCFPQATRHDAKRIFKELLIKPKLDFPEKDVLRSYILDHMLNLCEENALTFQVMLGIRKPIPGAAPPDYAISGFETDMISSFCPLLDRFTELNFDFFLASKVASHELTIIAKNYPNVYVTGYWWYTFYPTIMKEFLRERLQILPYNKINGFFSDAYVVPWSFAKASMARLQLALVLTEMVEEGYCTKSLAIEIAHNLLYDNPKRIYRL